MTNLDFFKVYRIIIVIPNKNELKLKKDNSLGYDIINNEHINKIKKLEWLNDEILLSFSNKMMRDKENFIILSSYIFTFLKN
jgi:hypothetical protein